MLKKFSKNSFLSEFSEKNFRQSVSIIKVVFLKVWKSISENSDKKRLPENSDSVSEKAADTLSKVSVNFFFTSPTLIGRGLSVRDAS